MDLASMHNLPPLDTQQRSMNRSAEHTTHRTDLVCASAELSLRTPRADIAWLGPRRSSPWP